MEMINDCKPDYIISRDGFIQNLLLNEQFHEDYDVVLEKASNAQGVGSVITFGRKKNAGNRSSCFQ